MYRWLSVIAKLVAIVGFAGLTLLCWIILLGSEEASSVVPWLLLISVFIAGPATIFSLLLSFLKEKIGYNLSFIFAVPLLVSAIWIVSYSIRDLLFALDARGIDALKIGVNTGFALLIFSPFALLSGSYILRNSKSKKLLKVAASAVVSIVLYITLLLVLFLVDVITLAGE